MQLPTQREITVLVVGSGLAGTATAIRLLQFARTPVNVVLLERNPSYRFGGVAYSAHGAGWDHLFNIQAGRMSVFREDVGSSSDHPTICGRCVDRLRAR